MPLGFLDRDPKAASINDILYARYLSSERPGDAENILLRKVKNNPREVGYRLQLAAFYSSRNKSQMEATVQYLLDRPQEFPQGRFQAGDFYNRIGNAVQALAIFDEGARNNPKERIR